MKHYETSCIICPHCDYAWTDDDMQSVAPDLYALAPNENRTDVECPQCDKAFWVQGGYRPMYTSVFAEEEL